MSANITPVDAFTAPVVVATDADAANGAEKLLTAQALTNRTENNNSRLNDIPQVTTVTNYMVPILGYKMLGTSNPWVFDSGFGALLDKTANARPVFWDVQVPPAGSTIDSFTVYVNGHSGRAGIPATPPLVILQRLNKVTNVGVTVSSQADTAGFVAYELDHTISKTGIAHTVLADEQYQILVFAEDSTNALPDLFTIFAIEIGWTYP